MPTLTRVRTRRFPGWRILGLATVTAAFTGPGQTIGVSVFIDSFIENLDLYRSAVASAYLIGTLTAATFLPWIGRAIDRLGVRRMMAAIGLAFGVAVALMSTVQGFLTLAAGFVLIRLLGQGALNLVSTIAVTLWFERRRGFVLGVLATGTGMLMSLVPIGSNTLIARFGWRPAWVILGLIVAVTVIPIAWFGMIDRPSDRGLLADGATADEDNLLCRTLSFTRPEALRTVRFWVLMAATSTVGLLSTALNFHQISILGDAGLTSAEAAAMFLPQFVGAAVAGVAVGWVADRLSGLTLIPLSMAVLSATLVFAASLDATWTIAVYALLLGASGGASRSIGSTLMPRWFGTDHIGSITGLSTLISVGGTALGPLAYSLVNDATGGYGSASIVFLLLPVSVAAAALISGRDRMTVG